MYKPNFCSECGGRIVGVRRRGWTSRRFCPECTPRFRAARLFLPVLAGAALFSLGLGAGRAIQPPAPPLVIERSAKAAAPAQASAESSPAAKIAPVSAPAESATGPGAARAVPEGANDASSVVSICGALTKKGTPCQRRVHGTGRCWQHQGLPAAIALEQRLITGR